MSCICCRFSGHNACIQQRLRQTLRFHSCVEKLDIGKKLKTPCCCGRITGARFENNQIIEARDHWDIHDLIQQLTRPDETAR